MAYAQNRAEEQPKDIWREFIIPPYFDELPVPEQRKALVFEGGRGCGKTTLLRYLCHQTQFSRARDDLAEDDLKYIGLYLRADTNFLVAMSGGESGDATLWHRAFSHWLACSLSLELVAALNSINCTPERRQRFGQLTEIDFSALRAFDAELGVDITALRNTLLARRDSLTAWINNIDTQPHPVFLPGKEFVRRAVEIVQDALPYLAEGTVAVFIDEYENLLDYQQQIVNELIKHGEPPLLFNIAVKRNGLNNPSTRGSESIQSIQDYRIINIEDALERDFELFAAELLFFRLAERAPELTPVLPIDVVQLRDPERLHERLGQRDYREKILTAASRVFPRLAERALAEHTVSDPLLRQQLLHNIETGLKKWGSVIPPERFIDDQPPEAALVCGAILNRHTEAPEGLLTELAALQRGDANRFTSSEWVKNNLVGVVLQLYSKTQRACPLFAGFETYVRMARGNVRHLLELVHQSFLKITTVDDELPTVPVDIQAEAVKVASDLLLKEVLSAGKFGNRLHALALSLGTIFREKHRLVTQSEPEINHFTITGDEPTERLVDYLREAVKWSVLYEDPETKKKNMGVQYSDYVLNPIFAGYFQISWRKKRSLRIAARDVLDLLESDIRAKDAVIRRVLAVAPENPTAALPFEDTN